MLKERQKSILDAVIQEYIETAFPVASERIVDKFRMPYSSATVRNELLVLDEAGFLEQPHISAGRIPTDKGYRFNIEDLEAKDDMLHEAERELLSRLFRIHNEVEFLKQVARALSEISQSFIVAGFHEEGIFYKAGISEVFREPEFEDRTVLKEFSELADFIDEGIKKMFTPHDFKKPRAFIGKENPIKEARNYGMVVSLVITPKKRETVVAILGPKRMDYRKNLSLFEYLLETSDM